MKLAKMIDLIDDFPEPIIPISKTWRQEVREEKWREEK
jgi:hypothetical protein